MNLLDLITRRRAQKYADGGFVAPYAAKVGQTQDVQQREAAVQNGALSTTPAPLPGWTPAQGMAGTGTPNDQDIYNAQHSFGNRLLDAGVTDVSSGLQNAMAATAQALGQDNIATAMRRSAQHDQERADKITADQIKDVRDIHSLGDAGQYAFGQAVRGAPQIGAALAGGLLTKSAGLGAVPGVFGASAAQRGGQAYATAHGDIDNKLASGQISPDEAAHLRSNTLVPSALAGVIGGALDTGALGYIFKANPLAKSAMAATLSSSLIGHTARSALATGGEQALQEYIQGVAVKHAMENPDRFGVDSEDKWKMLNAAAAGASMAAPFAPAGHLRGAVSAGIDKIGEQAGKLRAASQGLPAPGQVLSTAHEGAAGLVDSAKEAAQPFVDKAKDFAQPYIDKAKGLMDSPAGEKVGNALDAAGAAAAVVRNAFNPEQSKANARTMSDTAAGLAPEGTKQTKAGRMTPAQQAIRATLHEIAPYQGPKEDKRAQMEHDNNHILIAKTVDGMLNDTQHFDKWLADPKVGEAIQSELGVTPDAFKAKMYEAVREKTPDSGRPTGRGYDLTDVAASKSALEGNDAPEHAAYSMDWQDAHDVENSDGQPLTEHSKLNDSGARHPGMSAEVFDQFLATPKDIKAGKDAGSSAQVALIRTKVANADGSVPQESNDPQVKVQRVNFMNLATSWAHQREMSLDDKARGESRQTRDTNNFRDGLSAMLGGWEETDAQGNKYAVRVHPVKAEGGKPRLIDPSSEDFRKWLPPDAVVGFDSKGRVPFGKMEEKAKANAPVSHASAVDTYYDAVKKQEGRQAEFGVSKSEKRRAAAAKELDPKNPDNYTTDLDLARTDGAARSVRSVVNDVLGGQDGVLSPLDADKNGHALDAARRFVDENPETPFIDRIQEALREKDETSPTYIPNRARDEIRAGMEKLTRAPDIATAREEVAALGGGKLDAEQRRALREEVQGSPDNAELSTKYAAEVVAEAFKEAAKYMEDGVPAALVLLPSEVRHAARSELNSHLGRLEARTGKDALSEQEQSVDNPDYNSNKPDDEKAPFQDYAGMEEAGKQDLNRQALQDTAHARLKALYENPGTTASGKKMLIKARDMLDKLPDKALQMLASPKLKLSQFQSIIDDSVKDYGREKTVHPDVAPVLGKEARPAKETLEPGALDDKRLRAEQRAKRVRTEQLMKEQIPGPPQPKKAEPGKGPAEGETKQTTATGIAGDTILDTRDPARQQELVDAIQKITGSKIGVAFDLKKGEGEYETAKRMIHLAASSNFSQSNAFHEAFHPVFQHFLSPDQRRILWKGFRSSAVRMQIKDFLNGSPDAWEAAKKDPEEMLAYGFQAWHAGELSFKHEATSQIGKIFQYLKQKWDQVNNWLRDQPGHEELLQNIRDGVFADGGPSPVEIAQAKAARPNARIREVAKATFDGIDKLYATALTAYDDRLRDMANPHVDALAKGIYTQVGEKTGQRGFAQAHPLETTRRMNWLDKIAKSDPAAYAQTLNEKALGLPETNPAMHEEVRRYLSDMEKYAKDAGVKMGHVENYLPMSWDGEKIGNNRQAFIDMMKKHEMELKAVGFTPEKAADAMARRGTPTGEFIGGTFDENGAPRADHALDRVFTFLSNAERAPFVRDNLAASMSRYTGQMVKRAEWARRFGDDNSVWNDRMAKAKEYGLSTKDEELINGYKDDAFGVRLHDMNPTMRKVLEANTVYQNFRVLSMSLLSNLIDPFGVAVRSNDWSEAFGAYKTAMERMFKSGREKHADMQELGETIGAIERAGVADSLHQRYGGVEVEGKLRDLNDKLFRWNGMDGLTRSVRLAALAAGTRFIKKHGGLVGEGGNPRHLEELGLKPSDVQLNTQGQLKVLERDGLSAEVSERVQSALNRFVDEAALRPNIGERTRWGANPYLAPLYHLKQYTFTFNKVINKKLEHEFIEHDNPTPYIMASAYIPIMAATAMIRDGILHGGNIPANNGFLHYMGSGITRSGLMGPSDLAELAVGGAATGNLNSIKQAAGPTFDQMSDAFSAIANPHNAAAFKQFVAESLPAGSVIQHF